MPHPIVRRERIRKLRTFGFEGPIGGRHAFMVKGSLRLHIPNEHREAIGVSLLARILKQAGVDVDAWDAA